MKETPSEIIAAARALLAELRRIERDPGNRYIKGLSFIVYYLREPPLKEFMARLEKALNRMVSCPRCGKDKWRHIPCSLADACESCGYVRVWSDGQFEKGASIQEWASDIAKAANEQIRRPGTVANEEHRRRQPGSPASDC